MNSRELYIVDWIFVFTKACLNRISALLLLWHIFFVSFPHWILFLSFCSTLDDEGTTLRQQKLDRQVSLPLVYFQHCGQKAVLKGNEINWKEWKEKTGKSRTMREKPFIEESHHRNIFSRRFKENAFDKIPNAIPPFILHYVLLLQ